MTLSKVENVELKGKFRKANNQSKTVSLMYAELFFNHFEYRYFVTDNNEGKCN